MSLIYHITTPKLWQQALEIGVYASPSLKEEGFIHCCERHQIDGVIERYFQGKSHLLKLVIDTDKLKSEHVFEWSPSSADTFPHVYGPINLDAVVTVEEMHR